MNSIEKLTEIFRHFPGIGPRQARRFVYYLLTRSNSTLDELARNISELKKDISVCTECMRFFERRNKSTDTCDICSNPNRDTTTLMIVQRDIDLESVERNGGFGGTYFVLGGSVPILEKEPEKKIRVSDLKSVIKKKTKELKEIILGVSANPEGESTADYVKSIIKDLVSDKVKISMLGRGLSTGTELEYTDPDTFKNALKNRG